MSLPSSQSDWDDLDLGVTPKGSRKMLVNMDDTDSLGRVNEMYEDDDFENRDLDDLVFALKTGDSLKESLHMTMKNQNWTEAGRDKNIMK